MPPPEIAFRPSSAEDLVAVRALLASAALPSEDVRDGEQEYIVAVHDGDLVGCVGLETHGDAGLLRSLVVLPELRCSGVGSALHDRIVAHARARGVRVAYLLTTTAERFFAARGFEHIDRATVPGALLATPEFRSRCPATAVCMRRSLDGLHEPGRCGDPCSQPLTFDPAPPPRTRWLE